MLAASAARGWVAEEEVKPKEGSNRGANTDVPRHARGTGKYKVYKRGAHLEGL